MQNFFFCDTLYDDNYVNEDTRGPSEAAAAAEDIMQYFFWDTLYDENYVNEDTWGALVMTITSMKILGAPGDDDKGEKDQSTGIVKSPLTLSGPPRPDQGCVERKQNTKHKYDIGHLHVQIKKEV